MSTDPAEPDRPRLSLKLCVIKQDWRFAVQFLHFCRLCWRSCVIALQFIEPSDVHTGLTHLSFTSLLYFPSSLSTWPALAEHCRLSQLFIPCVNHSPSLLWACIAGKDGDKEAEGGQSFRMSFLTSFAPDVYHLSLSSSSAPFSPPLRKLPPRPSPPLSLTSSYLSRFICHSLL